MRRIGLIISAAVLAGCVSMKPTPEGMAVKLVENKPSGCKELGMIDTTGYAMDKEQAWNYLMNKVVDKGGDTVRIEEGKTWSMGTFSGRDHYYGFIAYAYNCP